MVTFFFHGHFHAGMKVVFDIKKYRQAGDCVSNSVNLRSFPELFEHFPDVYLQWLDLAFSNHFQEEMVYCPTLPKFIQITQSKSVVI